MKKLLLMSVTLVLFAFANHGALAQTVTGKVISSEDNIGVPGVNIIIKGTSTGVVTDFEGNYRINVSPGDVLIVSYVSFTTQEIAVNNQSVIDVTLQPDVTSLSEVIVTGYASQAKKDLTGSVSVVDSDELVAIPQGDVPSQLQGRASGVTVISSGQPGSPSSVRIRGYGSLTNNNPLYIVDGVPMTDIASLNPADVESMNVLKDAGAASIYGSRASNGVIIITTKKGQKGVQFNYNMYIGTQNPGEGVEGLLDTQGYADLQWLVYANDGTVEDHPIYGSSANPSPTLPSWAANTDWYDEFTDNALIQNHDLSFSGGNDKSTFFGGFGYFDQQGIVNTTYAKRVSARFNSQFEVFKNDRITVGENVTVSYRNRNGVTNLAEGSPIQMGSYRTQPIIPVVITQPITGTSHDFVPGEWGGTGIAPRLGNGDNVVANLNRDADDTNFDLRFIGSAFIDGKILESLHFRTTLGGTLQNGYYTDWRSSTYESAENVATPSFQEGAYYNAQWVWTNTLTYDETFNEAHHILAVGGYEANKFNIGRNVSGVRNTYFSDAVDFRTLNNGANTQSANSSANTPISMTSWFLRADYGFRDKYLISATVRQDGASVFGEDNKTGVFPSGSLGWRISGENFMSGVNVVTELKLRGGYGIMGGMLAVSPFNQFDLFGGGPGSSFYDLNGSGGSGTLQGFRPTQLGNPGAKWENNVTSNVGFDVSFVQNKVEFIFDWYNKNTDDLLYAPELPGTAGAATPPTVNIASMKNTGLDMQAVYRDQWGDWGFDLNLTFTTINNEITKIADGVEFFDSGDSRIGPFSRNEVGHGMSEFYGYKVQGLFQSDAEVTGAATQDGAEAGFFRYEDTDGSGAVGPEDRQFIGSPIPDFTYGLNVSVNWKGLDLTAFFYGSQGNDIYNWNKWWVDFWPSFQGQKSEGLLRDSWSPSNTGATIPKASNTSNFSTNTQSSSYYIEDGSYTRLKNLQLGYSFSPRMMSSIGLQSMRVYLQGINLFTATNYSGLDPELGGADTNFGVDRGNYPTVKQFLVGFSIGF